ncbi:MAG: hypothetical protein EOM08_00995 [Clostridia bacterium]|nr:hypothetical protein [Clostridia bacterium]NCC74991.1 hypothetical protein [Clostridia bacterium]
MEGENPSRGPVIEGSGAEAHMGADDPVLAVVVARSRAFAAAESNLDEVLDAVERVVTELGQRRLFIRSQRNIRLLTRVVRIQFQNLRLIELLEMPKICRSSAQLQQRYQKLAGEHELQLSHDRLTDKAKLLDTLISKTIVSRSRLTENWLLRLEILLLALFPLFHWLFD